MNGHTPGPWRYRLVASCKAWVVESVKNSIASVLLWRSAPQESEANARLIAAAPDLLALVDALEWARSAMYSKNFYCPWCLHYRENGHASNCPRQAALAKVEGE